MAKFKIRRRLWPFGPRWTFKLYADNGERLLPPEPYVSHANAQRGIEDLRAAVANATVEDE